MTTTMFPYEWIEQAHERISPYVKKTPLSFDTNLNIFLKWENKQITGSFKSRGAINKILTLEPWEQQNGLVTASAGNHGQGVALAGRLVNSTVIVFASNHAIPSKVEAMENLGAEVRFVEGGYGLAEETAIRYAEKNHSNFISAYNDGQIIAGQATIGIEILNELGEKKDLSWLIPTGGGGLISGIGEVLKYQKIPGRIIGIQPENSAFTHALFHEGKQDHIQDLPTLADGLSGPMQTGSITLPIIKDVVDDIILVSENEIAKAISFAWHKYSEVIEGSGATALAAIISGKIKAPAILIISGGNIQPEIHARICKEYN